VPHQPETPAGRRVNVHSSQIETPDGSAAHPRRQKRSRVLAVIVLVVMAVVIALVGIAAGDGGLGAGENAGTFRLLPITTSTS
jgi:hypothetical protein